MPKAREFYLVTGNTVQEIKTQLNGFLSRLADRVDKIEGLRGELETESGTFQGDVTAPAVAVTDDSDTEIHSLR